MNKVSQLFALAILSIVAAQSNALANYPSNPGYGSRDAQGYRQANTQYYNDQGAPNARDERYMMQKGQERNERMRRQDRNMIQEDRNMIRQGYDVNEQYYDDKGGLQNPRRPQTSRQEARMRGDIDSRQQGYNKQAGDNRTTYQANDAATPRSYPLHNDYPSAPRTDNSSSYQQTQRPQSDSEGYLVGDAADIVPTHKTAKKETSKPVNRNLRDQNDDTDKTKTTPSAAKEVDHSLADNTQATGKISADRTTKSTSSSSLNKVDRQSDDDDDNDDNDDDDDDARPSSKPTTQARSQR